MSQSQNRLTPTTKSIDDLYQLYQDGRLDLHPDYQRNSVWPPKAKAYLVDTVLVDKPIPMLFLFKYRDVNSNRMHYRVIDGQQRLRAVFAFLENRFSATESKDASVVGKRFRRLPQEAKDQFMAYSFVVMELLGFDESELRDIFARINKYVVRLNLQELRDAEHPGPFKDYVDNVTTDPVWDDLGLFTNTQKARKRDKEFVAELTVLMLEGPQDKKGSVELYFSALPDQFDDAEAIRDSLIRNTRTALDLTGGPGSTSTLLRRLPAFYGLMGALFNTLDEDDGTMRRGIEESTDVDEALASFLSTVQSLPSDLVEAADFAREHPEVSRAHAFLQAVSRQTDNVRPRTQCIAVLQSVIEEALGKAQDSD